MPRGTGPQTTGFLANSRMETAGLEFTVGSAAKTSNVKVLAGLVTDPHASPSPGL